MRKKQEVLSKMDYNHSKSQRDAIERAMREASRTDDGKRRYSDQKVLDAISRWTSDLASIPSLPTYSRYRSKGIEDQKFGKLLYGFFSKGPKEFRFITPEGDSYRDLNDEQLFVRALLDRFGTPTRGYDYSHIQSMARTYELYRRSWRVEGRSHFIRSLLRIELENGVYRLTEVQSFTVDDIDVEEVDEGFIIPYSTNFYAISNSKNCMKFYDFHDFLPEPAEDISVDIMRGNLMAIAGKGPHPSFRIYARRAKGAVKLGHYSAEEFSGIDEYKQILEYIFKID